MYLQNCYPAPKFLWENDESGYRFGAVETFLLSRPIGENVGRRMRALWHRFTCTAGVAELAVPYVLRPETDGAITMTIGEEPPAIALSNGDRYVIRADRGGVTLCAVHEKALMEGFSTLVQMIVPENLNEGAEVFFIADTEIHDAPAIGFRSLHLCIFPDSALSTIEKAIHMAGFLKFTHVVLEFWGIYPYECLPKLAWKDRTFTKAQIASLVDAAHSWGMEVIPMINHFGHASSSRVAMGRHSLLNNDLRYSLLFEPDGWTWCLSNPDTKKLLSEMRGELYDLCGDGSYFHLGFDEAYSFATCPKCRRRVPYELLAEYVNELTEDICAHGRRPIIWHDELVSPSDFTGAEVMPVANGQNHNTSPALDLLDRRIIIADWEYHYKQEKNASTPYFMEHGFDTIVCPWDEHENIRSLSADAKRLGAMGVMVTTWHHLPGFMPRFPYAANCLWQNEASPADCPLTEAAALLRRVYDTEGDYASSGWNRFEVEQ